MKTSSSLRTPIAVVLAFAGVFGAASLVSADPPPAPGAPHYLNQGAAWTQGAREQFYSQDQGSRLIPLVWAKHLTAPGGGPFLADSLTRYGYLANPASDDNLPVGFTASGPEGGEYLGMTCAACHTRDIEVAGKTWRVDGGPALSDFHALLRDLRDAVGRVRASDESFAAFATAVIGPNPTVGQIKDLRTAVDLWYLRQDTLFSHAFPKDGWGLGRLDAVSMIFNRLTGLDIGETPDRIIVDNIKPADAPVRYPFIWNAPRQDFTQWPGFAPNGNDFFGLVRNLGEVYGVFGEFAPKKDNSVLNPFNADYLASNSANFDGLTKLEKLVKKIGPPKWPFAVDLASANRGKAIFGTSRDADPGKCAGCHGEKTGAIRSLTPTWDTPLQDTGTDSRQYGVLQRTASTGVLSDTGPLFGRLGSNERQFVILASSVTGSIIQHGLTPGLAPPAGFVANGLAAGQTLSGALPYRQQDLTEAFQLTPPAQATPTTGFKYESRVLHGIWAVAPYLHNGSVASLAQLLEPAAGRWPSFAVGRAYDTKAVGLAKDQPGSTAVRNTTGCEDRNSGDSRCGHEFGTTLTTNQKKDLLEYLKTL